MIRYIHSSRLGITIGYQAGYWETVEGNVISLAFSFTHKRGPNNSDKTIDQFSRKVGRNIVNTRLASDKANNVVDLKIIGDKITFELIKNIEHTIFTDVIIPYEIGLLLPQEDYKELEFDQQIRNDEFIHSVIDSLFKAGIVESELAPLAEDYMDQIG